VAGSFTANRSLPVATGIHHEDGDALRGAEALETFTIFVSTEHAEKRIGAPIPA